MLEPWQRTVEVLSGLMPPTPGHWPASARRVHRLRDDSGDAQAPRKAPDPRPACVVYAPMLAMIPSNGITAGELAEHLKCNRHAAFTRLSRACAAESAELGGPAPQALQALIVADAVDRANAVSSPWCDQQRKAHPASHITSRTNKAISTPAMSSARIEVLFEPDAGAGPDTR